MLLVHACAHSCSYILELARCSQMLVLVDASEQQIMVSMSTSEHELLAILPKSSLNSEHFITYIQTRKCVNYSNRFTIQTMTSTL